MQIQSLHIYPIKSLGGILLQSSTLLGRGLEFDRRWMLVDSNGIFITQRTNPKLVLLSPQILKNELSVYSTITGERLAIPILATGESVEVTVWEDAVQAIEVSKEASSWFSGQLNMPVRLVYMPQSTSRFIDKAYAHNLEVVSFADAYPLLLTNEASLDDLNTRLKSKVDMLRFRPNIVVNGNFPFEEDNWSVLHIGNTKIEVVKQCARCVVVNINPNNAAKEKEVLQTLATYRKKANKVYFGVNALVRQTGEIKVGDELVVN